MAKPITYSFVSVGVPSIPIHRNENRFKDVTRTAMCETHFQIQGSVKFSNLHVFHPRSSHGVVLR